MNEIFFFQAEDGIRDLVRSRGLGDVYKRQIYSNKAVCPFCSRNYFTYKNIGIEVIICNHIFIVCLLYTSDAADDLLCVDLGGRRIIKKKTNTAIHSTYT